MTDLIAKMKDKKGYDLLRELEYQQFFMDIFEITDENEFEIKGVLSDRFYFIKDGCRITRRELAKFLRSTAYKIQHYKKPQI